MAVVYVDEEEPLCISGDSGGGIFVWGIAAPLRQDPLRKWNEKKDWRFSGIHSLAVSKSHSLYTGSGDRTIKAWSLKVSFSLSLFTYLLPKIKTSLVNALVGFLYLFPG